MSKSRTTLAAATVVMAVLGAASARPSAAVDDPHARRILTESAERHRSRSQEYVGEVVVTARNGKERRKQWRNYREGHGAAANRLIRFTSPPDVRGVGFLSRGRANGTADRWLYLPSMRRERRIAARDRETTFVGTDFSYEDLDEFDASHFDARGLPDDVVDGHAVHVIELVPRDPSIYSRRVVAIRKDTLYLVRVEFYDKQDGGLVKRLALTDYQLIDSHWIARRLEMASLRTGSRTVIVLRDIVFNRPQPADRFTIQNLVRGDDAGARHVSPRGGPVRASVQAPVAAGDRPSAGARLASGLSGYIEGKLFLYSGERRTRDSRASAWGTVVLRERVRFGRVRLNGALRLEQTSSREVGAPAFDLADRGLRRAPVSIRELSAVVQLAPAIDVEAGRFALAWGQTDGYSPADAFLPRDTSDPTADEKLPLWGARIQAERGRVRVEAVAVATTTPWRLPVLDGRNSPLASLNVYLSEPEFVEPPAAGFQAVRVLHAGASWDVGGWVRTGVRPVPLLDGDRDAAVRTDLGLVVPVRRRYARETAAGVEIAREYAGWIVRGEVSAMRSDDPELGDAVIWTFGGSRSFRNGMFTGTLAMNAVEPPIDPLLLFDRGFIPGFIVAVRQSETWGDWKAGWLGTFQRVGGILVIEIGKAITDYVKLTIGVDLPHGASISPARALGGNTRAHSALRWSW